MASFKAKKIDITSINGGQEFANGRIVKSQVANDVINASLYAQSIASNAPDISNINGNGNPSVSITVADDGTPKLKFENIKGATGATGSQGKTGEKGIGISSVEKTSTSGLVDTYTITYTDKTTSAFYVKNGENGYTPQISIVDGYWYVDGVNTLQKAQGEKGDKGEQGEPSVTPAENLLINGNFLINQRAKQSYGEIGYSADRWYISAVGNARFTPYLNLIEGNVGTSNSLTLRQYIENDFSSQSSDFINSLFGKSVVLSFDWGVLTRGSVTATIGYFYDASHIVIKSETATLNEKTENNQTVVCGDIPELPSGAILFVELAFNFYGSYAKIKNVKLEVGKTPTLYSPRPLALELLLCQRYYQVIDSPSAVSAQLYGGRLRFDIPLITSMPEGQWGENLSIYTEAGDTYVTGTSLLGSLKAINFYSNVVANSYWHIIAELQDKDITLENGQLYFLHLPMTRLEVEIYP